LAPAGGFPILVWSPGTSGLADACAPSKAFDPVPELQRALEAGFLVVVPDGQGLGTRGPAHYLIGASEARTTLDAARAAAQLPTLRASNRVAFWGYSAGGHGVLFAAQQASEYAPDLEIIGSAVVAPVVSVTRLAGRPGSFAGFTFLTLGGWSRVYGLDPGTIFTQRALARLPRLWTECSSSLLFDWPLWRRQDVVVADPLTTAPWRQLMDAQLAGHVATAGPVLVIQGQSDTIVSPVESARLVARLCGFGVGVRSIELTSGGHDIGFSAAPLAIHWLASRTAGRPATSDCPLRSESTPD
jgi:alpha-beta hydrolase superfamily lysophospholipase